MTDELKLPPQPAPKVDSLAALGQAAQGSTRLQRWAPYMFGVLTAIGSWVAAKVDTKLDIEHEVRLQVDQKFADVNNLAAERHAQVLAKFDLLELRLFSQDVRDPGRVQQIEKDLWFAFQGLSKMHAMALAGEVTKVRAAKEAQGSRFERAFDARAQGRSARLVYAELVDQVAVP